MERMRFFAVIVVVILSMGITGYVLLFPADDYSDYTASPTTVRFEKDTVYIGTVPYDKEQKIIYRFTNTGAAPLLIHEIRPSCGCTSVKWEKRPVAPGGTGEIKVTFKPNSLGMFFKTIEMFCNIPENSVKLKLKGNVTE